MKLNNGIEIPQLGVGTWTLRGATARENVRMALEAGFRHIDTAQMYENEAEVGQGITDSSVPAYSGDTRSPIPVISVHSVGNLQYRRQS